MSRETVNNIIKSCIVSRKGGVPINEIEHDYRELVGESIPYSALGYKTLRDFIGSIDFVNVKTNYFGDSVLFVSDPKIAHIGSLVSKQKNPSIRHAAGSKQKRRNRYRNSRQRDKKFFDDNRTSPSRRRFNNIDNTYSRPPDKFSKNTRMEYTQSKWFSDRPKDSWRNKRNENREVERYNNFNAGRPSLQDSSNNSSLHNDHSWSPKTVSPRSDEEDRYNFHSIEEKRYAEESRRWRFQVHVADNDNSTVGRSRSEIYDRPQENNMFVPGPYWGDPTNNFNYWWQNAYPNPFPNCASRDYQSGGWWPGLQGPANPQFSWTGMYSHPSYPGYYPWNVPKSSQSFTQ